jgi:hypothetical protein
MELQRVMALAKRTIALQIRPEASPYTGMAPSHGWREALTPPEKPIRERRQYTQNALARAQPARLVFEPFVP